MNASRAEGIIRNMNTMDAFKNADRAEMLQNAAKQVGSSLRSPPGPARPY